MNVVVIVVAAVACLFGGTMAEDAVKMVFTPSNSSTGSTGGLLGCKARSTSSPSGRKAFVRYQAVRAGGVEYSRVHVPRERMTFSDVVVTDFGSTTFPGCANFAKQKKTDAFSFENGQCVGYKIGDGICPCTKGDLVLYRAKSAIRGTSSAKALIVAKERAEAATLPAGYTRRIIYPTISMAGDNFQRSSSSCESVLADPSIPPPLLLHTANGECRYTYEFSKSPCNTCAGTATDVIVKKDFGSQTYLLSQCGGTVTAPLLTAADMATNSKSPLSVYSHEGYGCIPYTDPASNDNCDITVLAPTGSQIMFLRAQSGSIDIDGSEGITCDGDELYVYDGPADGSACKKPSQLYNVIVGMSDRMVIRFQRKPAHNTGNAHNRGFAFAVGALDTFP